MRPLHSKIVGFLPGLLLLCLPAQSFAQTGSLLPPPPGNLPVQEGSVNSRPFDRPEGLPGETRTSVPDPTHAPDPTIPGDRSFPPSVSRPVTDRTSSRSLGRMFELKRQEVLLKREIAVKKLKDQLSGRSSGSRLKTPRKGSPVTLLAVGIQDHRGDFG